MSVSKSRVTSEQLAQWQKWFARTHPNQPQPKLPVDPSGAKWTRPKLLDLIAKSPPGAETAAKGQAVYIKANCARCHRRGDISGQPKNDRLGPDLTSLGWRRQPKEIVNAILYPSHELNEEYPVTTVVLDNGKSVSGLLMPDKDGDLKVVDSTGQETRVRKSAIEATSPSTVSNMPAGLLEPLSRQEIEQLFALLSARTGDPSIHRPASP